MSANEWPFFGIGDGDEVSIGDGWVASVRPDAGRTGREWRWTIRNGEQEWSDNDLCEPACGVRDSDSRETSGVLRSLFGFLSAALESYPDGENADLFPSDLLDAMEGMAADVSMLGIEPESGDYRAWLDNGGDL